MAGGASRPAIAALALLLTLVAGSQDESDELGQVQVQLLQRGMWTAPRLSFSPEPTPLLLETKPLYWMHVPKTGSSWGNVLIHTPTICPGLPADIVVNRSRFCQACNEFNDNMLRHFVQEFPLETNCDRGFLKVGSEIKFSQHSAVGSQWESCRGHAFTIMRQPEQRLLSSYHHLEHDWPSSDPAPHNITRYAQVVQGCTVRTLMRDYPPMRESNCMIDDLSRPDPLTSKDIEAAKQRLSEMSFVGILEEWDISVCLWHVKFGGLCYGSDFADNRLPEGQESPAHDVTELGGFVDRIDGELYAHAKDLFWADAQRHGVSTAACQPCFDHAAEHWTP